MALPPVALALLDALDEPALLIAGERTVAANTAARQLLGAEIAGQDVRFAIRHPHALRAILQGQAAHFEVSGIAGVERSWSVRIAPTETGLILVRLTDVSVRRDTERAQTDFVANASHELRTPLATVVGYAETLAEPGTIDDDVRQRFGQQIHNQAQRMLSIVRDLISLSRIEADRFVEPREQVDLGAVVGDAVASASPLAEDRRCSLVLSASVGAHLVRGDAPQLRQLTDNLLHNALRYGCGQAGEQVEVEINKVGDRQQLIVRDHGDGIDARFLPRITERFYRVDDARSRDTGGTGLGLAIVKQIVERHRGELLIRSERGQGTEIEVLLPSL